MNTSPTNTLALRFVCGCIILMLGVMNNIQAQVYYDGFAFGSSGVWQTQIGTDDGWEDVTGISVIGYAHFADKAQWGTPFMKNDKDLAIPEYVEDQSGNKIYVGSIGRRAFQNSQCTSVYIPNHVTFIDEGAFSQCTKLEKVVFGKNLKHISIVPFPFENITDVYFLGNTPPSLADHFLGFTNEKVIVHVPNNSIDAFKNDKYFRKLHIVGMDADGISKIENEMKNKVEYRHKQWNKYVLQLQKNLRYFEYPLKDSRYRDVYKYIKDYKDSDIVERNKSFSIKLSDYKNNNLRIIYAEISKIHKEFVAQGTYTQQLGENKLLQYISTFADNISSKDIHRYFNVEAKYETYKSLTIEIISTKNTKKLYEAFWKGIMPFLNPTTYKIEEKYQSIFLNDAIEELSYKIFSKILYELYFFESLGTSTRNIINKTYRFSMEQQNSRGKVNTLGSKVKAMNLWNEIKGQFENIDSTTESERQMLNDCDDWCEHQFWNQIYTLGDKYIYPISFQTVTYRSLTQYGKTNENKSENIIDNYRFDISQPGNFIKGAEFEKFCTSNNIGFDEDASLSFGCPVIQWNNGIQGLYTIKTNIDFSTCLQIFINNKIVDSVLK